MLARTAPKAIPGAVDGAMRLCLNKWLSAAEKGSGGFCCQVPPNPA